MSLGSHRALAFACLAVAVSLGIGAFVQGKFPQIDQGLLMLSAGVVAITSYIKSRVR
jgi:urea transporter